MRKDNIWYIIMASEKPGAIEAKRVKLRYLYTPVSLQYLNRILSRICEIKSVLMHY